MSLDLAKIGINGIATAVQLMRANQAHSLTDYAKATRVEPIVLVDSDMVMDASTPAIMQTLLSTFAGYYLQAVAVSATVGRVSVLDKLDRLNPDRSVLTDAAFWDQKFSAESIQYKLPRYDLSSDQIAMEDDLAKAIEESQNPKMMGSSKENVDRIAKENANLSVGKVIGVEISDNNQKMTIPVAIRLKVNTVPSTHLAHILSLGAKDTTAMGRWGQFNLGDLDFWRDLIFCQDLITAHRSNLMKDKDGLYTAIKHRQSKNGIMGMLDMKPSLGTISNMALISSETASAIEGEVNGSLNNPKIRNKIFEDTALMILAVYNKDYERVTFYYHGIGEKSDLSMHDIKISTKGDGPNIADIVKAFASGGAAAF